MNCPVNKTLSCLASHQMNPHRWRRTKRIMTSYFVLLLNKITGIMVKWQRGKPDKTMHRADENIWNRGK